MVKNKQRENERIVITGGHAATSAIAIVEASKEDKNVDWAFHWIGPKFSMEGNRIPTLATKALPRKGVTLHTIIAGRLQRKLTRWSLFSFLRFPVGFIQAAYLLTKIKPDLILSFGGYAGFPVVIIGWLLRIPILLHDETYSFNRANKLSAPFANRIALSRAKSLDHYPKMKSSITGNPLVRSILEVQVKSDLSPTPVIYITGGSTGAKSINNLVEQVLEKLLEKYKIIHQVGVLDFSKFRKIKKSLPDGLAENYQVNDNIDHDKVSGIYKKADVIISRAGANSVSEIIAVKRPAILIPLVISNWNEQEKNALYAKEFGIARIMYQKGLTAEKLLDEVNEVVRNWKKIVETVKKKKSPDEDAAKKIVVLIKELIK